MNVNWEAVRTAVAVGMGLVSLFCAWAVWSMRQLAKDEVAKIVGDAVAGLQAKDKEISGCVDDVEEKVDTLDTRVTIAEQRIANLATKEDLKVVAGEVTAAAESAKAAAAGIARMEAFFIAEGVKNRREKI